MKETNKRIIFGTFRLGIFLVILITALEFDIPSIRPMKMMLRTASRYSNMTSEEDWDFNFPNIKSPREFNTELHGSADKHLRQLEMDLYYTRQFVIWQMGQLNKRLQNNAKGGNLGVIAEDIKHYFRVTQYDIWRFRKESGLQAWQTKELRELSDLIQHRIHALQNPPNCTSARKILCNYPITMGRGMTSQFHHLTYCVIAAYGTQRTLIIKTRDNDNSGMSLRDYFLPASDTCTKETEAPQPLNNEMAKTVIFPKDDVLDPRPDYYPKSIPKDIAPRLLNAHTEPFTWWIGQTFINLLKMNDAFKEYIEKLSSRLGFEKPIIGVQIRRTDKIRSESLLYSVEEYMNIVDDYFSEMEMQGVNLTTRRVFLVTDDYSVALEVQKKYPQYHILFNKDSIATASKFKRRSKANKQLLMADVYFLSHTDGLVCKMSSNICRIAYELLHTPHTDATRKIYNVDLPYYFHYQSPRYMKARYPHTPRSANELELQNGDRVMDDHTYYRWNRNPHNGINYGTNMRTGKAGFYPVHKTLDDLLLADTPSFDLIDKRKM